MPFFLRREKVFWLILDKVELENMDLLDDIKVAKKPLSALPSVFFSQDAYSGITVYYTLA